MANIYTSIDQLIGRTPLPVHKIHCSVLAEEAIKKALQDYYEKNSIEYDHTQFPDCESCGHGCGHEV